MKIDSKGIKYREPSADVAAEYQMQSKLSQHKNP